MLTAYTLKFKVNEYVNFLLCNNCLRLEEISLKYLYHVISEEKMLLENEVCRNLINIVKDRRTLPLSLASIDLKSKRKSYLLIFLTFLIQPLNNNGYLCLHIHA